MDTDQPRYAPGDDVLLIDPVHGWDGISGTVVRVVTIAELPHQTARHLYLLSLSASEYDQVYATEDARTPVTE